MAGDGRLCNRNDAAVLAFLFLVALGIRLYFFQFYQVISADGIAYVGIAKDFISGRGLASATHYPPFYPILLGLCSALTHDFESAGLAVSILMGSLLVVPVYLLGIEFFDRRTGTAAALLAASWPTLRSWSINVMSQATYITLVLLGIYCLWRAYRQSARLPAILAGVFFGCAHLTRSEGVLVLFAQLAVLVALSFRERQAPRRLPYLLLSLVVFFLVFSPYCLMLHEATGKWQLTGKSKVAIADALSLYLEKPDLKHDPTFQEIGYLDLFRLYPDYMRSNYLKNLERCWREMLPWYGWLLALFGLAVGCRNRDKLKERLFLLASFAPLTVIIVFFFTWPEYTQPYLPVLFLFIGNGVSGVAGWLPGGREVALGRWARCLAWAPVCLALLYGSWMVLREVPKDRDVPYDFASDGGRYDDKQVGLKLAKTLPANAVLLTRSGRVGFYSGRPYLMPPQSDYSGIVDYARKHKVTHLIATGQLLGSRPQLRFLFDPILDPDRPFVPPPELELITVDREPGGRPYIVYRFRFV